jgi:hypothetical protein
MITYHSSFTLHWWVLVHGRTDGRTDGLDDFMAQFTWILITGPQFFVIFIS